MIKTAVVLILTNNSTITCDCYFYWKVQYTGNSSASYFNYFKQFSPSNTSRAL